MRKAFTLLPILAIALFASCNKSINRVPADTGASKTPVKSTRSSGTTYYVDPAGNDSNNGQSTTTAWQSISKVNAQAFQPGDQILFKSGSIWNDTLHFKSSGTANAPIIIDKYGGTSRPVINGGGKVNGSKALFLDNVSYFEVNNLEITNTVPSGVTYAATGIMANGVKPAGNDSTHIYIKNCYVHDVNSAIDGQTNFNKSTGGIILGGTMYGALVQGCHISNCSVEGLRTVGPRDMPLRSKNIIFDHNLIENIYGDGIVMSGVTGGSQVTHNTVYNSCMNTNTVNYAGIWTIGSINTLVAYNEVYGLKSGAANDGMAFDADGYDTPSTTDGDIFEYNYSHDNNGGFMLFMGYSKNITVRYNVSVNDVGTSGAKKLFLYQNTAPTHYIYNNVFYITNPTSKIFWGKPIGIFSNNIFYTTSTISALSDQTTDNSVTFNNNCFYPSATFSALNWGTAVLGNNFYSNPSFVNPVSGAGFDIANGYNVSATSPCLNAGIFISNNGGIDFSGNPLPAGNPDVGAFQHSGGSSNGQSFGAIADAYVRNGTYATTNYGTLTYTVVKSDAVGYARKAYEKFDFSTVPASSVQTATLSFYVNGANTAPTRTISVYTAQTENWGETSINWNNAPTDTTYVGQIVVTGIGTYTLDVSQAINAQLAKSDRIVSFLLQNNNVNSSTNDINVTSREAFSNQPKLKVTY